MRTECSEQPFLFQGEFSREIVANFDGGTMSSDGGLTLVAGLDRRLGITQRLSRCFLDQRDPERVEHGLLSMIQQRVYSLAAGYEDLSDHDELRKDPLLAVLCGSSDPAGRVRRRERDRGNALAGKSTLNRLELSRGTGEDRYKRIVADPFEIDLLLPVFFMEKRRKRPRQLILDVDTTADMVHGEQEGRFFHGHYGGYCLQALYIFCEDEVLVSKLFGGDVDHRAETLPQLRRVVEQLRMKWPGVRIIVRGDSGFQCDNLMSWCEENDVDYVFGLAKNKRVKRMLGKTMAAARREYNRTGETARVFADFRFRTTRSWSRSRRVVGKAEYMSGGENPRFLVTNIPATQWSAQRLYETLYCARGEVENRIKEQQLDMFANRVSTSELFSNQLRLYFSTIAYTLLHSLRSMALKHTRLARAQCGTIRTRLVKIAANVRVTVRRVWVSMPTGCPYADLYAKAHAAILRC